MAILTGPEIKRWQAQGDIKVEPWDPSMVGPNSVDLHLGSELLRYRMYGRELMRDPDDGGRWHAIDSARPPDTIPVEQVKGGGWLLLPGRLYLGATVEYTETFGFVPYVDGRSSMGRLGLFAHVTAGRGDNGFCGNWTLELVAVEPLVIYPGQRIAQLTYHTIEGEPALYGKTGNTSGRYQGDRTPQGIKVDPRTHHPTRE